MEKKELIEYSPSFFEYWYPWTPTSSNMLRSIEKRILQFLKTEYRGCYVDIGPVVGDSDKIWTISLNEKSANTPLVLLHGLGSGVALWCMNLDAFASNRPVYAMDLLGFGRSSRPCYSSDAMEAEQQMVRSIEQWRKEMKLNSMILLGHSMGGFLASSYAINYPDRVKHLILADPWGFPERPPEKKYNLPLWIRVLSYAMQPLNPLWAIRVMPYGQWIIKKARPDLIRTFSPAIPEKDDIVAQYIYQCNAQNPTGESAFHCMMSGFGWAKNPIVRRVHMLREDIPITLIYGARSWVDNTAGEIIKTKRLGSHVNVQVIQGAGHHVYAEKADVFNKHVIEACWLADGKRDTTLLAIQQADSDSDMESDKVVKSKVMVTEPSPPTS